MKTNTLFSLMIFLFMIMGVGGCEEKNNIFENTAIITYSEPAADGCSWKININQKEYHPVNLSDEYKINGLNVNVKYNLLSSVWECPQWTTKKFQEIKIISITKTFKSDELLLLNSHIFL